MSFGLPYLLPSWKEMLVSPYASRAAHPCQSSPQNRQKNYFAELKKKGIQLYFSVRKVQQQTSVQTSVLSHFAQLRELAKVAIPLVSP